MSACTVLRLSGVVKRFPGVVALKGVSLEVVAGEVHALLGENGAGKSTLMGVAAGALAADEGSVEIGGVPLGAPSPSRAQGLGLSVVYQHTSVIDELTVQENLLYCVPPALRTPGQSTDLWLTAQLDAVSARFDRRTRVVELTVAERQLVEIAKALALRPKVLVLDEPTEVLTAAETEQLFRQIAQITAQGTAVIYISHRLPEVKRIADRITILRDGQVRGTFDIADISEQEILRLIIGRSVERAFPEKGHPNHAAVPLLTVRKLASGMLQGVDLDVLPGEVVGLAGVEGNGQRDCLRALAGLVPVSGSLSVRGTAVHLSDPVAAQDAGIVHLPGDRHAEGVFMALSVRENLSALVLERLSRFGLISQSQEMALAEGQIRSLAIKAPSMETRISSLSGGNQQKVLFGRSLLRDPSVLLADEPTRGVDAGARMELYCILRLSAEAGAAVIILSSDAIELQGLCDRVLVFSRGQIVRSLSGDEISEENITGAAINADTTRAPGASGATSGRATLARFLSGDLAPTAILIALIVILGAYAAAHNSHFLNSRNISQTLFLASALAFVSIGQLIVLLTAGVDLSVGPLTGLVVVILSFFAGDGQGTLTLLLGLGLAMGVSVLVGLYNGVLVRLIGLTPVIATLTTYIALQGASLLLRPTPDGYIRTGITDALTMQIGPLPVAFLLAVAVMIGGEVFLRRARFGMELRAVGSDAIAAHRLGAKVARTVILAYMLCSLFSALGGLMLAAQVGIGDPSVGQNYTLQSLSAVVLGGASIFGGRGSFLGALAGVILIQEVTSATGFLSLGAAWQYWLPGLLILLAAGLYSRTRVSPGVTHH